MQYHLVQRAYRYGWSFAIEFVSVCNCEVKQLRTMLRVDDRERPLILVEITWKNSAPDSVMNVEFLGSPKLAAMDPRRLEVRWTLDREQLQDETKGLRRINLEFLTNAALGERN